MIWLAVSAVFVLPGVFVAPHFFSGVVIFVPFLWIGRPRPRTGGDERAKRSEA